MSLFDASPMGDAPSNAKRPLAERMRPDSLDDFAGQEHVLGPGKPLRSQIERDQLTSLILWGPPGVGKTTLAQIIARGYAGWGGAPSSLSMKFIALTRRSRTRFCRTWSAGTSF